MRKKLFAATLTIIVAILLLTTIILPGCNRPSIITAASSIPRIEIPFEIVNDTSFVNEFGGTYPDIDGKMVLVDSLETIQQEVFEWIVFESDKSNLLKVDYSQYFVLILFNGYRNAFTYPVFHVLNICKNINKIIITAHFDDLKSGLRGFSDSSQYQIIKIKRMEINISGEVIFSLLDEEQKERDRIFQMIS